MEELCFGVRLSETSVTIPSAMPLASTNSGDLASHGLPTPSAQTSHRTFEVELQQRGVFRDSSSEAPFPTDMATPSHREWDDVGPSTAADTASP